MPRRKPSPAAGSTLRREIAGLAARMMAEDGIADYGFAKRKAAKNLGASDSESLPTNDEIETELRTYLSLYQEEEQPERLQELRLTALEIMELLADFRPYLTGAVLDGTAGRYAGIEIDLYADSAKDVEIALLSRNISYDPEDKVTNRPGAPETRLRLDWNDIPVLLSIYPLVAERRLQRNPHTGYSPGRARIEAVAALLK